MASEIKGKNKNTAPKKTREDYAEDALYREVWEEVNNEKTMAFVKKYYRILVAGALVILIGVTALQIALHQRAASKMAAAQGYEAAVETVDAAALANLAENTSGATADLALFQAYMLDGDVEKLERLAAHGATRDFRDLAKIHIVNLRGDDMTGADVEKYLDGLNTKKSPYYFTAALVVARRYLADGDTAAAAKWLDKITSDKDAPASIAAAAEMLR